MKALPTLKDQVAKLKQWASNPQQRIRTGLPSLDMHTQGPAPGEVYTILGRSYSGKSIVAENIMWNNRHLDGSIFFSLEMPSMLAVERLYAIWSDTPNKQVQEAVRTNTLSPLIDSMAEEMGTHIIVDRTALSTHDMGMYVNAYEDYFGHRPAFVIVDYLELVAGAKTSGEGWLGTESQAQSMKDFAKDSEIPVFLLHQTNKQEKAWEAPTADSARGGGYTEADFVVGMWRPHLNPALPPNQKANLFPKLYMTVLKNRPFGSHNTEPLEFYVSPSLRIEESV